MSKQALFWQKMKSANEREGRYLNMKLQDIRKKHAENLQLLHKDKCDTTAELRSYHFRQLRSDARRKLYGDRSGSLFMTTQDQHETTNNSINREKHHDMATSRTHLRGKGTANGNIHLTDVTDCLSQLPAMSEHRQSNGTKSGMHAMEVRPEGSGDLLCIYYQPDGDLENTQRHKKYNTLLPPLFRGDPAIKVLDRSGRLLPLSSIPSKDLPSYVYKLRSLRSEQFDSFTDGAMALAVRRFRQIQRESMPPLSGHLPVRVRYNFEYDVRQKMSRIRDKLRHLDPDRVDPPLERPIPIAVTVRSKTGQLKPKHALKVEENAEEIKLDNEKLHKLKKANQANKYKQTLTRVDTFIGAPSQGTNLVHEEDMSLEEIVILKSMAKNKMPMNN